MLLCACGTLPHVACRAREAARGWRTDGWGGHAAGTQVPKAVRASLASC